MTSDPGLTCQDSDYATQIQETLDELQLECYVLPSVHERCRIGSDLPTSKTPGEEGGQWPCQS
jgi:hypothetical protein